jgi:thioredoxin-like negative regulator of GroEL
MTVNDSAAAMSEFMSEGGWTFPVMLDADSAAGAYGVRGIPTVVVIDGEGMIVKRIVGPATAERLTELVDDLTR